jgi:hypothetical protein
VSWPHVPQDIQEHVLDVLARAAEQALDPGERGGFLEAVASLRAQAGGRSKGYRREFARQVLVVEGRGRFPLEMAERDVCTPASEADALRMREGRRDPLQVYRIVLSRFIRAGEAEPHRRRWESFGWRIVWHGTQDAYQLVAAELAKVSSPEDPTSSSHPWGTPHRLSPARLRRGGPRE